MTDEPDVPTAATKSGVDLTAAAERYEIVEVHRSQLTDADYNPRILPDKARAKLKAGIKKNGLVAPPVWNVRTGHIVAGHQRIAILDGLKGTKDYRLRVAQVDVDDVTEKELNLLLNNPEAMGEWDLEKLEAMLHTDAIVLEGTGFDAGDVYRLFGDAPLQQTDLDDLADRLRVAQQSYADVTTEATERDSDEFYIVVVFKDGGDRSTFLSELGLDDNRFQDGRTIRKLCAAAGTLVDAAIPEMKITDPAALLDLRNATRRELGKLRELARHFLEGMTCSMCGEPLLPREVFTGHKPGDARGGPLPEVGEITEHHRDGNHDNNDPANRELVHDFCHHGYHNAQRGAGAPVIDPPPG